eukprot:COSAG01_NODE_620_length_14784_cov_49.916718_8_plen_181_part_00
MQRACMQLAAAAAAPHAARPCTLLRRPPRLVGAEQPSSGTCGHAVLLPALRRGSRLLSPPKRTPRVDCATGTTAETSTPAFSVSSDSCQSSGRPNSPAVRRRCAGRGGPAVSIHRSGRRCRRGVVRLRRPRRRQTIAGDGRGLRTRARSRTSVHVSDAQRQPAVTHGAMPPRCCTAVDTT